MSTKLSSIKSHHVCANNIPYILDLESTNGTILNGEKVDSRRYYEIHSEDMIKFGESTREYIFIKDPSISS